MVFSVRQIPSFLLRYLLNFTAHNVCAPMLSRQASISVQINPLHPASQSPSLSHQISKILPRNFTLLPRLHDISPLLHLLAHRLSQSSLKPPRWNIKDLAHFAADALRVGVHVIQFRETLGDFLLEALGERVWDLGEDVGGCSDRCYMSACYLEMVRVERG